MGRIQKGAEDEDFFTLEVFWINEWTGFFEISMIFWGKIHWDQIVQSLESVKF